MLPEQQEIYSRALSWWRKYEHVFAPGMRAKTVQVEIAEYLERGETPPGELLAMAPKSRDLFATEAEYIAYTKKANNRHKLYNQLKIEL